MKTALITTAAAALIAGTTLASAQTGKMHESGASSGSNKTGSQAEQKSSGSQRTGVSGAGSKSDDAKTGKGAAGTAPGREESAEKKGTQSTHERSRQSGKNAHERNNRTENKNKADKNVGRAQGREENTEKSGTEDRTQTHRENREGSDGKAQMNRENRDNAQGRENRESAETRGGSSSGSVQLSQEQRTRVHDIVGKEKSARVDYVDFSVSVGTVVPRSVHLYALPSQVVEIIPQYRSYKFIIASDEIMIIDPDTFRIVAIIPA